MMNEKLITDRPEWKLKVFSNDCDSPNGLKHLKFTGEQYNEEGELTSSSTYDFFLNKEELSVLSSFFQSEFYD